MTTTNLARIERVDLREAWPDGAQNFTPWLAENLADLGEALGMDLELRQVDAPLGVYHLDILATDLNSNRPVIIENQLEATNHSHLGLLLTCAAGFDAGSVIWITSEFQDEHRQALDWLNQRTGEDTQFFGVAVELWRIGGSLPAPNFLLAALPDGWRKQGAPAAGETQDSPPEPREREAEPGAAVLVTAAPGAAAPGEAEPETTEPEAAEPRETEPGEKYREFFQPLIDDLREMHNFTTTQAARPQNRHTFSAGYGQRVLYGAGFTGEEQARVELYIDGGHAGWNLRLFERLEEHKEEVDANFGYALDWQRLENSQVCRIAIDQPGSIDDSPEALTSIRGWMTVTLLKFKDVFEPLLKEMLEQ